MCKTNKVIHTKKMLQIILGNTFLQAETISSFSPRGYCNLWENAPLWENLYNLVVRNSLSPVVDFSSLACFKRTIKK